MVAILTKRLKYPLCAKGDRATIGGYSALNRAIATTMEDLLVVYQIVMNENMDGLVLRLFPPDQEHLSVVQTSSFESSGIVFTSAFRIAR